MAWTALVLKYILRRTDVSSCKGLRMRTQVVEDASSCKFHKLFLTKTRYLINEVNFLTNITFKAKGY